VVSGFQGHIKLDPRTDYYAKEGDIFQYFFYQDGSLFETMLCYPHPNRCELIELNATGDGQTWLATLAETVPDIKPFVLHVRLPPKQSWREAANIVVSVESPGLGEIGTTTLSAMAEPAPAHGLRERLSGELRLRALYTQITQRYAALPAAQRVFPESHAAYPVKPPCQPTRVADPSSVPWLGLLPPGVLSWSFEVQSDPTQGTVRLTARRDLNCKGDIDTLVLDAKLGANGDFEREPIVFTAHAGPH
jgi:hypothetical protein